MTILRKLAIPIYPRLTEFYVINQKKLLIESIRKKGNTISEMVLLKHASIKNFQKDVNLLNIIKTLSDNHHSDEMGIINFQKYENKLIPSPSIPVFFKDKVTKDPIGDILSLIDDKVVLNAVKDILNISELNSDIFGFRTVKKNGRSIIQGKLDCTFSSMSSLAHELGHCLYEINHDFYSLYGYILSEFFAQIFEQFISDALLLKKNHDPKYLLENREYCKNIIKIDYFFYKKELADLLKKNSDFFYIAEEFCVFRPSYFYGTGLQIIYGESSKLLSQILDRLCHQNKDKIFYIFKQLIQNNDVIDISMLNF